MSAVVKFKVLKPQRLKEKDMRLALLNGLRAAAKAVEKDYKATVASWETEVEFETIISLRGSRAEFLVGTSNKIYEYVDKGTKPHVILPKKAKMLRFQTGYNAKTTPGIIGSTTGGATGGIVYSKGVMHPGTKARRFSELINKKHEPKFKNEMHKAMRIAAEKSGHKI